MKQNLGHIVSRGVFACLRSRKAVCLVIDGVGRTIQDCGALLVHLRRARRFKKLHKIG